MVSTVEYNPNLTEVDDDVASGNISEKGWMYYLFFDPDVCNRILIKHHEIPIGIVILYILFVKWIGPHYMKNRKPYNLKKIMIIYNFMNAVFSLALAWMLYCGIRDNWHRRCELRKHVRSYRSGYVMELLPISWFWILNKHLDLLDTIFFVLRKKYNLISFLHVSHHGGVLLLGLYVIKFNAFSNYMMVGILLNSIIHILMYTYYGLAACGPGMQKYLWWKKYMTQMQIGQFIIILSYVGHSLATGCDEIDTFGVLTFAFAGLMLVLFQNFYKKSYKKHQS